MLSEHLFKWIVNQIQKCLSNLSPGMKDFTFVATKIISNTKKIWTKANFLKYKQLKIKKH